MTHGIVAVVAHRNDSRLLHPIGISELGSRKPGHIVAVSSAMPPCCEGRQ